LSEIASAETAQGPTDLEVDHHVAFLMDNNYFTELAGPAQLGTYRFPLSPRAPQVVRRQD